MASPLGSVVIELAVNLAKFRSEMGQAAQVSQTRLREIERQARATTQQLSSVGRTIRQAFGVLGVGVGLSAIISTMRTAATEAIRFGDEMAKAAAKTGVAASEFSELAYAARQNDIQLESLSTAFRKMQQAISQAGSGAKAAKEVFAALGIEFDAFRALAPDEQFELLADRINQLKDPADRARAAVELFGRSGADLLPLFEQGAAGIRKLREEAVRTGRALTEDQIAKLAEADQAIKNLTASWDSFARSLTAKVAPSIVGLLDKLTLLSQATKEDVIATLLNKGPTAGYNDLAKTVERRLNKEKITVQLQPEINPEIMRRGLASLPKQSVPGFKDTTDDAKRDTRTAAERAGLFEIPILARQITAGAMADMYRDMDRATETAVQEQLRQWIELEATIRELQSESTPAEFRISGDEAERRLAEIQAQFLDPEGIQITAQKIFPPEEQSKLTVFAEEAARNIQSAFADFLFDPLNEGFKGMLAGFLDTVRRMVAELAAQQLLLAFFNWGAGLGGGVGSFFGGLAKGITKAGGGIIRGPGTGTSDSIPAWLSDGEYVVRAAAVAQPGVRPMLEAINAGRPALQTVVQSVSQWRDHSAERFLLERIGEASRISDSSLVRELSKSAESRAIREMANSTDARLVRELSESSADSRIVRELVESADSRLVRELSKSSDSRLVRGLTESSAVDSRLVRDLVKSADSRLVRELSESSAVDSQRVRELVEASDSRLVRDVSKSSAVESRFVRELSQSTRAAMEAREMVARLESTSAITRQSSQQSAEYSSISHQSALIDRLRESAQSSAFESSAVRTAREARELVTRLESSHEATGHSSLSHQSALMERVREVARSAREVLKSSNSELHVTEQREVRSVLERLEQFIREASPAYAGGGYISGPGTGTSDSIFARVSNGEYVVRAAAVAKPGVLPLLEQINEGMPRFASGGLVSAPNFSFATPTAAPATAGQPVNVSYQIDARGADADRIMAIMPAMLRQTEERTIAQVRDLIKRGRMVQS